MIRQRRPAAGDDQPPSPCIRRCTLNEAGDLCLGCGRSLDEIMRWSAMSAEEKRAILARLAASPPARPW